jgi:hypothetical protein
LALTVVVAAVWVCVAAVAGFDFDGEIKEYTPNASPIAAMMIRITRNTLCVQAKAKNERTKLTITP